MTGVASKRKREGQNPPPIIDLMIESPLWESVHDAEAIVRQAIDEAAREGAKAPSATGDVAVVLTDDAAIRALNRRWRNVNAATNVLSFPTSRAFLTAGARLGDIVIAYETTVREAHAEHKPLGHHLAHLAVHGFLHLLGYDHESDETADAMEGLERTVLARLGVPDPYVTRNTG